MPADERDVCALGHRVLDELVVAAARCVMDRRAPVQISTIHVGSVLLNEIAYGGGWIAIPSTLSAAECLRVVWWLGHGGRGLGLGPIVGRGARRE
jgi:hypothetical protein